MCMFWPTLTLNTNTNPNPNLNPNHNPNPNPNHNPQSNQLPRGYVHFLAKTINPSHRKITVSHPGCNHGFSPGCPCGAAPA